MSQLPGFKISSYKDKFRNEVIDLWERCDLIVPWNDPDRDIDAKLKVMGDLFLVGTVEEKVIATVMVGYEGHRGWVNYLAVDPEYRRREIGHALMERAGKELRTLGCPKINVQISTGNLSAVGFYDSIGFTGDDVISMGKRLS